MKPAPLRPRVQLFVCTNAREASDPLRSACGTHGPRVYQALKRGVATAGRSVDVWVTRTLCLGQCPASGCAVAIQPGNEHWVDVTEGEADALLEHALTTARPT